MSDDRYPKPCPGNGTCCNRDEFNRTVFPCSVEARLLKLEEKMNRVLAVLRSIKYEGKP